MSERPSSGHKRAPSDSSERLHPHDQRSRPGSRPTSRHGTIKRSPPGTVSPGSSHGEGSRGPTWKTESHSQSASAARGDSGSPNMSADDGQSPRPVTPGTGMTVNRNQPAFISKLYAMLQDQKYADANLIYWAPDGRSFICPNPIEFARDVLPNFYKTNNFQSFVRQLNMYSFNKVSDLCSATQSDPSAWEFRHPLFCRDEPEKIHLIQRKAGGRSADRRQQHAAGSPDERPSTAGIMFNSPQRPSSSRHGSAPRLPQEAMYPRYERYEREPQTTYWNHQPAPASTEGDVAALERELQYMGARLQAERHESARQSLELHGHLLRMTDMVADLSANDTHMNRDELFGFRADVLERYKQLQRQVADGQRYYEQSHPPPPAAHHGHPPSSSHSSSSYHDRYHPYRRSPPGTAESRPSSSRYEQVPRAPPPNPWDRGYDRYYDDEYYRRRREHRDPRDPRDPRELPPRQRDPRELRDERFDERAVPEQPASLRNILH